MDDAGDVLLAAWVEAMSGANRSARTITERTALVRRAARHCGRPAHELTADDVTGFLSATSSGARPTYYAHLHAWSTWLVRRGVRPDAPTMALDRPKAHRRTPHTISTLHVAAALSRPGLWPRTRTMVLLGAYLGMRASEIASMRGAAVDVVGGQVAIRGKGDVTRHVPLHPIVRAEAERYGPGWWFPSYANPGEHVRATSVSKTISELMTRAGVPGTCHDLRRWFATMMVDAGHSVATVQRLLGHSSIATTQRYVSVGRHLLIDAVLSLPDVTADPAA